MSKAITVIANVVSQLINAVLLPTGSTGYFWQTDNLPLRWFGPFKTQTACKALGRYASGNLYKLTVKKLTESDQETLKAQGIKCLHPVNASFLVKDGRKWATIQDAKVKWTVAYYAAVQDTFKAKAKVTKAKAKATKAKAKATKTAVNNA